MPQDPKTKSKPRNNASRMNPHAIKPWNNYEKSVPKSGISNSRETAAATKRCCLKAEKGSCSGYL